MSQLAVGDTVNAARVEAAQYLRTCKLIVFGNDLNGIDLSEFRIKFSVKRVNTMTPNVADIRVYNLDQKTALQIQNKKEFSRVILQAGYGSNYGVIFLGNIKQLIIGRESATDTFVDIVGGDGDLSYNFAIVNATLASGSQLEQVNALSQAMAKKGVDKGYMDAFPTNQLPRGKVMFGNARKYMRDAAQTTGKQFSIQDEKIVFVSNKSYLPSEAVVVTSKTGMIGTPQQTNEGVNLKCLLNPLIQVNGRVKIDNASVEAFKINQAVVNSPANIAAPFNADGVYFVLAAEHTGDTRGIEWYTSIITLNQDVTSNPINSVQIGFNG